MASITRPQWVNSLAPGGFDYSLKLVNFRLISTINILSIFCEFAIRWMPQHLTDHKSTLVQVMAWCRQASSHYLSHCWHRSISPYGVTRPQWVKMNSSLCPSTPIKYVWWCYDTGIAEVAQLFLYIINTVDVSIITELLLMNHPIMPGCTRIGPESSRCS